MKRIGSNLRPAEQKPQRNLRNIIRYSDDQKPKNDYPKRIISPTARSECCTDENREVIGTVREVDGFKYSYRVCKECGHAVRFFYPAVKTNDDAVRKYRNWKKYMAQ